MCLGIRYAWKVGHRGEYVGMLIFYERLWVKWHISLLKRAIELQLSAPKMLLQMFF